MAEEGDAQGLPREHVQALPRRPTTQKKERKAKEHASVMFGRQNQRGVSSLLKKEDARPKGPNCFDGCFAGLLGYPGAGATGSSSYAEPELLKELRPVPKWEDATEKMRGSIKCVEMITMPKEDTPGWRNQDSATRNCLQGGGDGAAHLLCSVCDGHGKHGDEASQVAADRLPRHLMMQGNLLEKPKEAFKAAVNATDADLYSRMGAKVEYSGTTCVAVLVDQVQRTLHVANVGDSRAVLGRRIPDAKTPRFEAIPLTEDQKPDASEELDRIRMSGGHVQQATDDEGKPVGPARVWDGPNCMKPGLGMSRTMGDGCARECGVIADPVVTCHRLTPEDRFVLIATDGLWDSLPNKEAIHICSRVLHLGPKIALNSLVKAVREEEGGQLTDDTTIMLVVFNDDARS